MSLLVYKYNLATVTESPMLCSSRSYSFSDGSCLQSFTELWAKEDITQSHFLEELSQITFWGYSKQVLKKIWLIMCITKVYQVSYRLTGLGKYLKIILKENEKMAVNGQFSLWVESVCVGPHIIQDVHK